MNILKGITKIVLSPIKAVTEIVDDIKGENGDDSQFVAIATTGVSSLIKGLAKGIKEGSEDIFDD